jgi:hypothetical protein
MKTVPDILRYSREAILYMMAISASMSCGSASPSAKDSSLTENEAIFSSQETEQAAKEHPMIGLQSPYWKPTTADMKSIRVALIAYLRLHGSGSNANVAGHLDEYRLQYLGYSDDGERFVLVNGFCRSFWESQVSWRSSLVFVLDGGSCLFRANYRIEDSKVIKFEVNGES